MADNEFHTIPLSRAVKFVVDNRGKTAPTAPTGIALIATNCVTNDHLYPLREKLRFVSRETYETWFRAHPQPGDILLTNKGSQNGAICLVPSPVDFVIAQDMVAVRPNEELIDPLYLFAALRSPSVQHQIRNLDVSGIIPHFKKTDFDKLFLPYPDRHTQQKIGQLYFRMCWKIELNWRMNETLQEIARTIFAEWFPTIVASDPSITQNSIAQIASISRASVAPGMFPDEPFEHYSIPAYDEGQVPKIEKGSQIKSHKFLVTRGSVLLSKLNPRIPRVWLPFVVQDRRSICSTEFLVLDPNDGWSREFIYGLCNSTSFQSAFSGLVTGTSGSHQRVKPEYLERIPLMLPPAELANKFTQVVAPLHSKVAANLRQNTTLQAIRDVVLPKLISGEIRIDQESHATEAVL